MLRRLIQWLKNLFRSWFGEKPTPSHIRDDISQKPAPPLTDTDLEFLFNQLIEGVHQAKGQDWAQKWLNNIEHRVSTERWVEWLRGFGEKLLASPTPNNELAARLVKVGEVGIGKVGSVSLEIGMQLLRRNQGEPEPIWEYDGPDAVKTPSPDPNNQSAPETASQSENLPTEGTTKTVTLDELLVMLQQDETICQQISQQLGIETNDPEEIIQELINQYHPTSPSNTNQT
ncbi:hypothetical protein VB620_07575 [Nodularia harveyana UHCC-0300]|uniref:Uncharacterized protein n=1 Tax=Nodularia harveyana UHCC-0300 TaxID=2974287 RepID=A0ABU5UCG3_9CYAN|nr:hypothetical protein [Nodularia harveyana]MEA5581197.1 hypothetical protein [Nodularia harveyana UHCC-0300]